MGALCKAILFQQDFWAIAIPNVLFTLLLNGVIDAFLIRKAFAESKDKTYNAMQIPSFCIFLCITVLLLMGQRKRQISLITSGELPAWPRALYKENFLSRTFLWSLREPTPGKREFQFFVNVCMVVGAAFFGVREVMLRTGVMNKYTVFAAPTACLSCAVAVEAAWKAVVFMTVFSLQYAASMYRGQVEIRTTPL